VKKRILAILLIFAFVFTSSIGVYAKGARSFGGGRSITRSFSVKSAAKSYGSRSSSKSYSSRSSSKSFSLFGSSKSKSSSTKSSSSKGSSSRSIPGSKSYAGSSGKKANTSGFSAKTASKKNSYMQDTYKSQVSGKNFNTYKQKLNSQQKKVYDDTIKKDFGTSTRRMNFEDAIKTRASRINVFNSRRPVFINVNTGMFGSPFSYGYAYVGPWDLWFLMRASELFWFHHWNEISPYRNYFDQQQYQRLEQRVHELEQQGVQRDPNYLEEDVDPDLQLSQQYQEQNVDKVYYTDKYPTHSGAGTATAVVVIILSSVILVIVIRSMSRPKRRKAHSSRIY
jgi:hypothetical protein